MAPVMSSGRPLRSDETFGEGLRLAVEVGLLALPKVSLLMMNILRSGLPLLTRQS